MENLAGMGAALAAMRPADGRYDNTLMRSALPGAAVDDSVPVLSRLLHRLRRSACKLSRSIADAALRAGTLSAVTPSRARDGRGRAPASRGRTFSS
jgi:hypothetical protein